MEEMNREDEIVEIEEEEEIIEPLEEQKAIIRNVFREIRLDIDALVNLDAVMQEGLPFRENLYRVAKAANFDELLKAFDEAAVEAQQAVERGEVEGDE